MSLSAKEAQQEIRRMERFFSSNKVLIPHSGFDKRCNDKNCGLTVVYGDEKSKEITIIGSRCKTRKIEEKKKVLEKIMDQMEEYIRLIEKKL